MSNMEWTREKTLMLINEYRQRRGLWDMTSDEYRKKEVKHKLLKEVSDNLGGDIPIIEIEKKFHTLRTQYHREINRMNRKQHNGSKWFGFHNLKFLSSPKACRSGKGRRSELSEDGIVTTKYIIRETTGEVGGDGDNNEREFITIPSSNPKATITYEAVPSTTSQVATSSSRSRELEKLIEETTKDVEETEELKPKVTIKEISVPLEQHTYNTSMHSNTNGEMDQTNPQLESSEQEMDPIAIHNNEDDIVYHPSNASSGGGHNDSTQMTQHPMPTRIIKIQRSNTCQEDDYYEDEPQITQSQIHAIPSKRIYFDDGGQHHTTILTGPPQTPQTALITTAKLQPLHHRIGSQTNLSHGSAPQHMRDEFSTYGEYVANEMRNITNREVLIVLKNKINIALFEANMSELQK